MSASGCSAFSTPLPAVYEIHVWAWESNLKGSYADWNTRITCVYQPD
jgi:hypothetical protein